jgi:hypothetical protein
VRESGDPERRNGGLDAGQRDARDAEDVQQLVGPLAPGEIEQQRARRIGVVGGEHIAFSEVPDQPRVDGAEADLARRGALRTVVNGIEQPRHLAGREHRVEDEAGALAHELAVAYLAAHRDAVRPHCQLMTGPSGEPVVRSHATTDSRWLEIPTDCVEPTETRPRQSAVTRLTESQISAASLCTQPGWGNSVPTRTDDHARTPPVPTTIAFVFVVP